MVEIVIFLREIHKRYNEGRRRRRRRGSRKENGDSWEILGIVSIQMMH